MKQIVFKQPESEVINFDDMPNNRTLIVAKKDGEIRGFVQASQQGYIVRVNTDPGAGAYGYSQTLEGLLKKGIADGYSFYIN